MINGKNYNSVSPQHRLRGIVALGVCGIITSLWLCYLPVGATETEPVINEPQETEEEILDSVDDDTGTIVDGDVVDDSDSESGQSSEEGEMEIPPVTVGCTCGEEIVAYFESQALMQAELDAMNEPVIYATPEEIEATPALLSRYEYEVVKRLEFVQYCALILIGLLFILIFKKK